jgi:ketopantoate reductase
VGERWSKLTANTMTTGVSGASGLDLNEVVAYEPARRLQIRLAAEAIQVGIALGFKLEMIRGLSADKMAGCRCRQHCDDRRGKRVHARGAA